MGGLIFNFQLSTLYNLPQTCFPGVYSLPAHEDILEYIL